MDENNFNQYEENNTNQGYQEFYDNEYYDEPAVAPSGINVQGLVGMILGIVGCVSAVCCCGLSINSVPTLGMGIAAIVLGNIGRQKEDRPKAMANAAFIMGIVVVVLAIITFVLNLTTQSIDIMSSIIPDFNISNMLNQLIQGN